MTLQNAFQFLVQIRTDAAIINNEEEALPSELNLDTLAKLGEASGLFFTPDELRTAFKHDWAMRWRRYEENAS